MKLELSILALLCGSVLGCGPVQCKRTDIVIEDHPSKPKPAGRVKVNCDGQSVLSIESDKVGDQ